MRRGETSTLRSGATLSRRRAASRSLCTSPGASAESSSWRTTDSQTLYGSSSQPISMRRVLMRRPPRGTARRPRAHAPDVHRAIGDADHAARVEHVEGVAALEHVVVGRHGQTRLETALGLVLVLAEVAVEHVGVGDLEVVAAELALVLAVDVAVGDGHRLAVFVPLRPHQVVDLSLIHISEPTRPY